MIVLFDALEVLFFGRSAMYRRKGIFAIKNRKPVAKKPEEKVVEKKNLEKEESGKLFDQDLLAFILLMEKQHQRLVQKNRIQLV